MFNIVYLDTTLLKDRFSNKDLKLMGPIKTFKSVFNTTLTELINRNIHQINALEVIYFEELKILPAYADFDSMLQEEYTLLVYYQIFQDIRKL